MTEINEKEIEAAREAWREYWSDVIGQYDDNKGPMEGMRRALEAAARVRSEANAEAADARSGAVKPLDLSNLLRHAFISGFKANGGDIDVAAMEWTEYDPNVCAAYSRILSALEPAEPAPAAEPFARYARLIQIVEKLGGELNIEIDGKPEYVVTVRKVEADDERS